MGPVFRRFGFGPKKKPVRPQAVEKCLAQSDPSLIQKLIPSLWARRRVLFAFFSAALILVLTLHLNLSSAFKALLAWDAAALIYLSGTWWIFFALDGDAIKRLAAEEDEAPIGIFFIAIGAITISMIAIFKVLSTANSSSTLEQALATPITITTLLVSWVLLHTVFTLHYARLYFGDYDKNGQINGGVDFPYKGERSYFDFLYLSLNIAVAFQVSDIQTKSRDFRNAIMVHTVISYLFNTIVLALGINIAGNLIR